MLIRTAKSTYKNLLLAWSIDASYGNLLNRHIQWMLHQLQLLYAWLQMQYLVQKLFWSHGFLQYCLHESHHKVPWTHLVPLQRVPTWKQRQKGKKNHWLVSSFVSNIVLAIHMFMLIPLDNNIIQDPWKVIHWLSR